MLRWMRLAPLLVCLALAAQAQTSDLPDLPATPTEPAPARKAPKAKKQKKAEASSLPELPDLPTLLEADPEIKATRPDGKKIVGLAWSAYSAAPGELNELEEVLRGLLEKRAVVEKLPAALFPCSWGNT